MAMNVEIVVPKNPVFDFVQCVTKKKEPVVDIWHFPPPPLQLPAAPPPDLIFLIVKENIFSIFSSLPVACCPPALFPRASDSQTPPLRRHLYI